MNGYVNGLSLLELFNGSFYYLPCDIEWGIEGTYLIYPIRYYKMISDDLFVIKSIKTLEQNKVICYLENAIRLDNGQVLYEITVQLDHQNFDKILKSNILSSEKAVERMEEKSENLEIPEAIVEPEDKEEIIFKQSEIPQISESEKEENKMDKPVKKAKWYKFWRYFW